MTQAQLDREVARATGESVEFVRNSGFSEVQVPSIPDWTRKAARIAGRVRRLYRRPAGPQQPMLKAA
jgi:hypothetical protein